MADDKLKKDEKELDDCIFYNGTNSSHGRMW